MEVQRGDMIPVVWGGARCCCCCYLFIFLLWATVVVLRRQRMWWYWSVAGHIDRIGEIIEVPLPSSTVSLVNWSRQYNGELEPTILDVLMVGETMKAGLTACTVLI